MPNHSKNFDIVAPQSPFYHGPFGRLCPDLPAWAPQAVDEHQLDRYLLDIANNLMEEAPGKTPTEIAENDDLRRQLEHQFSSNIPAGYTYFGQFVDHDISFDPASSLMRRNDPNGLLNHRTPRLDLDNIYGAGVDDQPYLYNQDDKVLLAIGEIGDTGFRDLPRYRQRALIGDMRNDENAIVSQLQLAFLLAHNSLVCRARDELGADDAKAFEMARKTLRWLYQHIVWNDFLRRVTLPAVHRSGLRLETSDDGRVVWENGFDDIFSWKHQPFMPVEFSVAAYRFGHSLVRNSYQTNNQFRGFNNFAPIFDNSGVTPTPDDLRGFRPMETANIIQWDWFLPMTTSSDSFPQMARKIDTKLSNALSHLFEDEAGSSMNVLAFRNLKRGLSFGLPSASDLAKKFCIPQVPLEKNEPDALWYAILKEAELAGGNHLGHLGSLIVCATFAGLLKGDPSCWMNVEPCWEPANDPLLKAGIDNEDDPNWTLASIIRLSGLKPNGVG